MKALKILSLLIVTLISISLVSCGKSSNKSSFKKTNPVAERERAMVGMWRCDYDDDYSIRTYYEDGTGTEVGRLYSGSESYESTSIYYIDQKDNMMKIVDTYTSDYDGQKYSKMFTVTYINDHEMRLDGLQGPHIYHRIK